MRPAFPKYLLALVLPVLLLWSCSDGLDLPQSTASLTVAQQSLDGSGGNLFLTVKAAGKWTLTIEQGTAWISLSTTSGSGNRNNVVLTYEANPRDEARTGIIILHTEDRDVKLTLTQGAGSKIARWLELPQTSSSDIYDFYTRNCTINGKTLRNYSFYYSDTDRLSRWVAYPLCSSYMGSSGRTDAWGYDPLLPAGKQQNITSGYKDGNNGWYARGHQLPSADRTASKELNATTFYSTNMTPQNNDFNAGIWETLESKIRTWANASDTLYVVTGCVTAGSKYYVYDRSGASIPVPTAYFKAILRYSKSSTLGNGGYNAAAFWFDHKAYGEPYNLKAQSLSISELESKLGYSLFVNLPDRVSATTAQQIKSEQPKNVNWWW